jgi:hypothetical protein
LEDVILEKHDSDANFENNNIKLVDTSSIVNGCIEELEKLPNLKKKFAIVRMWPDQAVAEHENVERFRAASNLLGIEIIEVDKNGVFLNSPNQKITNDNVDFVLHLHFETAKTYNATSVAAMWNPTQFYFDWGFDKFWSNQMSHDVYATTGSKEILGMIKGAVGDINPEELPQLNHTIAEPVCVPNKKNDYKIFYCGINWEKINGKKGRHDEILKKLDQRNLINIYGPEEIQGVKVWDGFNGYKGSLPFDGKRVIKRISEAGVCLVFSSDAHIASNIMSNRLFEAMAGGAVVIGDEHPFIREAIGDNYICVPTWLPVEKRFQIILDAMDMFNEFPEKALALAQAAQKAFLNKYFLCSQLVDVYKSVVHQKNDIKSRIDSVEGAIVDLVVQPITLEANDIEENLHSLKKQIGDKGKIFILVDDKRVDWFKKSFGDFAEVFSTGRDPVELLKPCECVAILGDLQNARKIIFLTGIEQIFGETILSVCASTLGEEVVVGGYVIKHMDAKGLYHYDYVSPDKSDIKGNYSAISSVIFDAAWIKETTFASSLDWADIQRVAELNNSGLVMTPKTFSVIELRKYEIAISKGITISPSKYDTETIISHMTRVQKSFGAGIIKARSNKHGALGIVPSANILGDDIVEKISMMERTKKVQLALDLYHSMPIPKPLKGIVTGLRKFFRIK